MKDTAHHLKSIQKKVLQAARKEARALTKNAGVQNNNGNYSANAKAIPKAI